MFLHPSTKEALERFPREWRSSCREGEPGRPNFKQIEAPVPPTGRGRISVSPVYLGQMPGPSHSRLSNISRHCHAPSSPLVQGDVSCLVIVEGPGFRRNRGNWIKRIHYHCERTPDRTPVSLSLSLSRESCTRRNFANPYPFDRERERN